MAAPLYETFAREIIQEAIDGSDWDNGDVVDLAVKRHILKRVPYDPMVHGDNDFAEPGDSWYEFVEPAIL